MNLLTISRSLRADSSNTRLLAHSENLARDSEPTLAASTPAEAVAVSPLVVICLLDSSAVEDVLSSVDAAVNGRVGVNVTSGWAEQAQANERRAAAHGADYIEGKIMGDPPYVGTPQIMFAFSGSGRLRIAHRLPVRAEAGQG